jgi:hypothetical protein
MPGFTGMSSLKFLEQSTEEEQMARIAGKLTELIGNTPLLELAYYL